MKTVFPSNFLKFALIADAVVSGAVAALQLAAPDWLSQFLLMPQTLLINTGVFLVGYTAVLVLLALSSKVWSALIMLIIIGNVGWAAGCVALLVLGVLSPNALGVAFVLVQAIAVLIFAALEFKGLAASEPAHGGTTARA